MSFPDAVATQPDALRLWVLWLSVVMIAAPLVLLAWRATRRDGMVTLGAAVAVITGMQALYAQVGFVRLLGLPHVLIWTPLALYLAVRLRQGDLPRVPRVAMVILLASIGVSLVFDWIDVARYLLLGQRESLIPDGAG